MSKLNGKVAVVTGSSNGIGLAIAKRFVAEGAYVFITGRRKAELERAKTEIGKNVTAVVGDAARVEDLDHLYATIAAEKGNVDIVVANAGINASKPLASETPESFDATFALNVRGVFFTVQKSLPLLVDGGSIVLVASAMSVKGLAGFSTYSASKAAVRSFARTWAAELKERGVRVNTLSPGAVDTPLLVAGTTSKEEGDKLRALYGSMIPIGRIARPEEIASAALFLASSDSSYSTGIDLVADGGFTQL